MSGRMNAKFSNLRDSCSSSLSSLNSLPHRQHSNRLSCKRLQIFPADSTEDLKKDMKELLRMDDFDECRARANSGGSLYGVLRKRVLQRGGVTASSFKEQPSSVASILPYSTTPFVTEKQRSRSMIHRGVSPVTGKDKGILMVMCEYTEKKRKLHGQEMIRRHSAAVLQSCQRQNSVKKPSNLMIPTQQFLKPISPVLPLRSNTHRSSIQNQRLQGLEDADNFPSHRLKRTLTPGRYSRCRSRPTSVSFTPQLLSVPPGSNPKVTIEAPDFEKRNFLLPPTDPQGPALPYRPSVSFQTPEPPALHPPTGKNSARFSIVSNTPVMTFCRRRSFSLTQEGALVNDGDEMITIPTSPAALGTPGENQDPSPTLSLPMEGDFIPGVCYGTAQRSRTASIFSSLFQGEQSAGSLQNLSTTNFNTSSRPSTSSFQKFSPQRQASISPRANVFRVLMLGGPGVGKTALAQQFVTSEYMAAENTSFDDGIAIPIPIVLEGEESVLEFIDLPYTGELNTWREYEVDAYIIVYSITDRRSYQKTVDLLYSIREGGGNSKHESKKPIIVVANKSDLERSRIVGKEEGRTLAEMYGSKYIDVSAILNHKVDDLLVGILKQVRLNQNAALVSAQTDPGKKSPHSNRLQSRDDSGEVGCFSKSKHSLLTRLVRRTSRRKRSRSCENLLRL